MMIAAWLGWITFVIGLSELMTFVVRKFRLKSLNHFRGRHHMAWGKIMLALAGLHGLLTGLLFTLNLGTLCFLGVVLLWGTYHFRKRLGKYWLKIHRALSLGVIVLALVHALSRIAR